jgi:hypothetical protein
MALTRFQRAAAGVWTQSIGRAKRADWAAVAGEIVIVVLGILIAFQLDRWSEHWRRDQERRLYLERLAEESDHNLAALEQINLDYARSTGEVFGLIRALPDPARRARIATLPEYGCGALHLPAARLQTAAIDEAASTSALELIPDPHLRYLLHSAAAYARRGDRQLDYFRASFQRFGDQYDRYAVWHIDPADGTETCHVAQEALSRDPGGAPLLARIYRDRRRLAETIWIQIAAQRVLRDRARCLLDGRC